MNKIKLNFLYRDAGNYKNFHEVIASNNNGHSIEEITKAFNSLGENFVPTYYGLPSMAGLENEFLPLDDSSDDHPYVEFIDVEEYCGPQVPEVDISKILKAIKEGGDKSVIDSYQKEAAEKISQAVANIGHPLKLIARIEGGILQEITHNIPGNPEIRVIDCDNTDEFNMVFLEDGPGAISQPTYEYAQDVGKYDPGRVNFILGQLDNNRPSLPIQHEDMD